MMKGLEEKVLRRLRSIVGSKSSSGESEFIPYPTKEQRAENARTIKTMLESDHPVMVARVGTTELDYLIEYKAQKRGVFANYWSYIQGHSKSLKWDEDGLYNGLRHSGIFPRDPSVMTRFCERMLNDIQEVDLLGTWQKRERLLGELLTSRPSVHLSDLEPYYFPTDPWSAALEGKRILVVHPFESTITSQYQKRHELFPGTAVLPEFELQTIKAVQSIYGLKTIYKDWFEALEYMEAEIAKRTYDVAIIGCGAYGLPLAAFVKRSGRKAIHMGGATQILFGIKGKRWEDHKVISAFYNEHWVRPSETETPQESDKIVYGSYW